MRSSRISMLLFLFAHGEAFQLGAGTSDRTVARAAVNRSTTGCADGTREGFTDLAAFPDIAACSSSVQGYHVASAPGCASGWRVCTGQDVWDMQISYSDAVSFSGMFAFDSNHDCGSCHPTCCTNGCQPSESINGVGGCSVGGGSDPDLSAMGSSAFGGAWGNSCMVGGRIDIGGGCTIGSGATGVVCCKDPAAVSSAVGDPHLQNVHGERFDLMKKGKHVLISIPRGTNAEQALLLVRADALALGDGCADMYFQEVNVTGSWAEAKSAGGYHHSVAQPDLEAPEWVAFGKVHLKVVHGRTSSGLLYLNVYVKHLRFAGFAVGGLLGEDDHEYVSIPSDACAKRMALIESEAGRASEASLAVASFE